MSPIHVRESEKVRESDSEVKLLVSCWCPVRPGQQEGCELESGGMTGAGYRTLQQ